MNTLVLRDASTRDAATICRIYNPYILESCISFEEIPVDAAIISRRIQDCQDAGLPWLVAELDGEVLGYAYASRWRARSAYRHAVEGSVYLAPAAQGRKLGSLLYQALIQRLREGGLHTLIGGIALPNAASEGLHRSLGFREVARFEQVGWKFGRWLDVAYWQLQLTPLDEDERELAANVQASDTLTCNGR